MHLDLGWDVGHEGVVDGRRVVSWSAGAGPVVLFLHGWALSPASYRDGLARIAERRREQGRRLQEMAAKARAEKVCRSRCGCGCGVSGR